jgi:calcineurin-like phosphoesterase family protein
MRKTVALAVVGALALPPPTAGAGGDEHRYLEAGSQYQYAVRTGPLPQIEIGALAARLVELANHPAVAAVASAPGAGTDARGAETVLDPATTPEPPTGSDPPAVADGLDGAAAAPPLPSSSSSSSSSPDSPPPAADTPVTWLGPAPAPFGAPASQRKGPDCATIVGDPAKDRIAALVVRKSFQVGGERARVKVLRLRARFQDGLVASINDVEVVRRNLEPAAAPGTSAARAHGPEWESFYISAAPGLLRDGENLLTVEVRPARTRLAPLLDLELVGREQAHLVRGPIVQRVGRDRATILFETDLPTTGEVRYGDSGSEYPLSVNDAGGEPTTRHALELTALPVDAEIHYQAAVSDGAAAAEPTERSGDFSFHTAPREGDVVRFVVYGDVRSGHDVHAQIVKSVLTEAPDLVITTGDMVLRGSDEADWQRYFAVSAPLLARVPVYPVIGNHDMGAAGNARRRLEDVFALPDVPQGLPVGAAWYAFDFAGLHLVSLDSNRYDDDRQLAWLEADLAQAEARGVRAIFASAHQGPYSRGPHGGDALAAQRYVPVLQRHHASVFFSGHDHLYQRGLVGRLHYVVAGGGGAPLYQPRCGGKGQKRCPSGDGAKVVVSAHHYLLIEVYRDYLNLCPRTIDGTPLEECQHIPIPAHPAVGAAVSR